MKVVCDSDLIPLTHPDAKPVTPRKGSPWLIQIDQSKGMDPTLKAANFKFLYQFPGGVEVLTDAATTHKSDPLKMDDTLTAYTTLAVDASNHVVAVEAQVGDTTRIVVIPPSIEKDGKKGTLAGLLGEVDAGWKLFPLHTIKSMKRPQ